MSYEKETAFNDFMEMIQKSWTWAKLNQIEKEQFIERMEVHKHRVKGSYRQRWESYQNLYSFFIYGCGYLRKVSCDWR